MDIDGPVEPAPHGAVKIKSALAISAEQRPGIQGFGGGMA